MRCWYISCVKLHKHDYISNHAHYNGWNTYVIYIESILNVSNVSHKSSVADYPDPRGTWRERRLCHSGINNLVEILQLRQPHKTKTIKIPRSPHTRPLHRQLEGILFPSTQLWSLQPERWNRLCRGWRNLSLFINWSRRRILISLRWSKSKNVNPMLFHTSKCAQRHTLCRRCNAGLEHMDLSLFSVCL